MGRSRKGWLRGAAVIGVAGAMMAVALLSPALAVKLATTGFVKQKVNQAKNQAIAVAETALRAPDYVGGSPGILPAGSFGVGETTCGTRHAISGGASAGGSGNTFILESYPSDGNLSTLNISGRNGWTVTVGNPTSVDVPLNLYAICADTSLSSGTVGGPARGAGSKGEQRLTIGSLESRSKP